MLGKLHLLSYAGIYVRSSYGYKNDKYVNSKKLVSHDDVCTIYHIECIQFLTFLT